MASHFRTIVVVATCFAFSVSLRAQTASGCQAISTGPGASLNGFVPFNANSPWNMDISGSPADANSDNIINFIGTATTLHPDFGSGEYAGSTIGIPYQVESAGQPRVHIDLGAYRDESDPGPASVPHDALIEGYPHPDSGDRHVLVLEKGGCWLYELYNAHRKSDGTWSAASAALWDLLRNEQRPYTWTSADAAGLPIFAGLVRYDEVSSGEVRHAFRYTLPTTRQAFVLPATHWASSVTNPDAPPMGMRLRLKASYDISGFSATNQVILTALKKYGMILADNGSGIFLSGAPDSRWNNDDLGELKKVTASDFEVVQMGTIYTPSNIPTGDVPAIQSFTVYPASVSSGSAVRLMWSVTGSEYNIIDPKVGAVRGSTTIVYPTRTTTYKLQATNQYGRSSKTVRVTVR